MKGLRGCSRDMARVRGVGPGDYDALIETTTAVLRRDPGAVAWQSLCRFVQGGTTV